VASSSVASCSASSARRLSTCTGASHTLRCALHVRGTGGGTGTPCRPGAARAPCRPRSGPARRSRAGMVVLPRPTAPLSATISPRAASNETPATIRPPAALDRERRDFEDRHGGVRQRRSMRRATRASGSESAR
jgi:hypothetical protein